MNDRYLYRGVPVGRGNPLEGKRIIDRCANVCCPNRTGEGRMVTVHVGEAQHRSVVVVLCTPCAEAF